MTAPDPLREPTTVASIEEMVREVRSAAKRCEPVVWQSDATRHAILSEAATLLETLARRTPEVAHADTGRLDFLEAFCDGVDFELTADPLHPIVILDFYAADGGEHVKVRGENWREAIDAARESAND